jgi:hypothetical protein
MLLDESDGKLGMKQGFASTENERDETGVVHISFVGDTIDSFSEKFG